MTVAFTHRRDVSERAKQRRAVRYEALSEHERSLEHVLRLRDRKEAGDEEAGTELVRLCRAGMLEPYWEAA